MKDWGKALGDLDAVAEMTREVLDCARRQDWDKVLAVEPRRQSRLAEVVTALSGPFAEEELRAVKEWGRRIEADHAEIHALMVGRLGDLSTTLAAIEQNARAQAAYRGDAHVGAEIGS